MKTFKLLVFLNLAICLACTNDSPVEPDQVISKISAFDVGNAGDASDIRVAFTIEVISEAREARIPSSLVKTLKFSPGMR